MHGQRNRLTRSHKLLALKLVSRQWKCYLAATYLKPSERKTFDVIRLQTEPDQGTVIPRGTLTA